MLAQQELVLCAAARVRCNQLYVRLSVFLRQGHGATPEFLTALTATRENGDE